MTTPTRSTRSRSRPYGAMFTAVVVSALGVTTAVNAAEPPQNRLECIAPADPGGGWDFTCRQFASVLQQSGLTDASMQTINMAGAAGGVAYAHVASKRRGNDGLIVAASSSNATRLAQDQYPGLTVDNMTWLGTLGADYAVLAVNSDSSIQDLSDMTDRLKEDIKSVSFSGGSGPLGWDQLNLLRVLFTAEVPSLKEVTYLDFNNGASAITQVLGQHLDVVVGDVSEVKSFVDSGDLRVLAVLADERLPAPMAEMPTAVEQGIDVVAPNWRGFYAPAELSEDDKAYWIEALDRVYASAAWQEIMTRNGLTPFHLTGMEFDQFLREQIASLENVMLSLR
ncbi:Bug family tripartite tricarboxylate transporter substrate binding protein [Halomonas sp. V046]|uniref:Bug family tripartite tricarboxylate transporter substrate binding protein n=1 Tax=Halomonas sp. V046 TaxID=3459611 RepID=UPI004044157C